MRFETSLDWRSAGLFLTIDRDWKRKLWIGGWLLVVPVVGWPIVLGYRRDVLHRVVRGESPILPEWHGNLRRLLAHGLGATGVIHAHFAPLYLWVAYLLDRSGVAVPWLAVIGFIAIFPIFSTLIVPAGIAFLRFGPGADAPGAASDAELLALSAAFALLTFYVPAGFLRVSRSGRLVSAFAVVPNLRLIARAGRRYVEAWIGSSILGMIGHLCAPLSPFGVVWCYLAIVFSFNEVPLGVEPDDQRYLERSWFRYFRRDHWRAYDTVRRGVVVEYRRRDDDPRPTAGAPRFRALELGPLRVPLPA